MHFQRVTALTVALAVAAPLSLFAETRSLKRTDMQALAEDLERALGQNHVEVNGRSLRLPPPEGRRTSNFEEAVVDAMNRERAANGLAPLHVNSRLELAADDRITDMFSKHYFNHVSPDGLQPWSWVEQRGYNYRGVGENLAVGYPNADAVVAGWMHSPGHRANILGRDFNEVGIAMAAGSPEDAYRGPTVVALYGDR